MDLWQGAFRLEAFFPKKASVIPSESLHEEGHSRSGSGALGGLGLFKVLAARTWSVPDL